MSEIMIIIKDGAMQILPVAQNDQEGTKAETVEGGDRIRDPKSQAPHPGFLSSVKLGRQTEASGGLYRDKEKK